jgi:hypothetical protein
VVKRVARCPWIPSCHPAIASHALLRACQGRKGRKPVSVGKRSHCTEMPCKRIFGKLRIKHLQCLQNRRNCHRGSQMRRNGKYITLMGGLAAQLVIIRTRAAIGASLALISTYSWWSKRSLRRTTIFSITCSILLLVTTNSFELAYEKFYIRCHSPNYILVAIKDQISPCPPTSG